MISPELAEYARRLQRPAAGFERTLTRWDEAVRRGTPALVTQAAPTSEPILRRLDFEEVCRLRRLEDPL